VHRGPWHLKAEGSGTCGFIPPAPLTSRNRRHRSVPRAPACSLGR
jgi:hypothetical protein